MNKEEDMKEVELNEMDQEKQPMTGETPTGTEKNGCVKVKVPENTEVKFTGLSKEELMKVADAAGALMESVTGLSGDDVSRRQNLSSVDLLLTGLPERDRAWRRQASRSRAHLCSNAGDEVRTEGWGEPEAMWDLESQAEDDKATQRRKRNASA
ncbi:hypothetical protein cypCar_00005449 [Cyprinus carpio]|nr:hypothetical protein cypCar_00005449 [Cyprinus carpio]